MLFDEIEKAHSVVIQSLLTVLDKGITKDQTSQEEVDFSQCIVIFTTNLGQDLLADNPENKPLSVFDLLSSSKNASNKTELSPEFINRLAKGYPIIFNKMRVNHLLRLAERTIGDSQATNEQFRCHFPEEFASFMLKTMSPELSVRRLQTALTKLQSEILSSATPYLTLDADQVVVDVEIETQDAYTEQSTIKLLLLDDDHRVYDQLNSMNTNTNRSLCSKSSDVRSAVESHLPDALLIDLDTLDGENLSLEQFIENEAETLSKLPIFTYRIVEGRAIESSVSCLHDVREHFVIGLNDFEIAFISMLGRIDYYVAAEKMLLRMVQRKEELSYRCSIESSEQKLIARFHNQGIHQVIQSEDLRDSDFFKMSLPDASLDDVIGLDRAKKRLTDVINWLKTPEKLTRFGVRVPSGFLFAGPPGTGKTLLAKAVAGESKMPFFAVSASELTENHLGGTTKNIQKLFETARKYAPSIIFIDEIDAIAAKRTEDAQGADRERNLIVNALLTEMDGFNPKSDPVFVMAATNLPQSLDPAIVRPGRFDETIMCDLPNRKARELFFNRFSARYNVDFSANDLAELASSSRGMSSAQIEQVFREAIYQAVGEGTSLSVAAVKNTMVRVMYGSPTENIVMSEKEKLRTAYHEAGHLLVSRMLFPNQAIDFVTIEPRNQALGFVVTRPEELYDSFSTIRIKHRLEMLLAGRIAEKLFTGCEQEISSGASNDIKKATELAMHAIYESGLEPEIGPVNVAILTRFEESNILIAAQNAVQKWIRTAEVSVEQRLLANKELLDLVATTLHSQESMLGEEIENLLENCSLN